MGTQAQFAHGHASCGPAAYAGPEAHPFKKKEGPEAQPKGAKKTRYPILYSCLFCLLSSPLSFSSQSTGHIRPGGPRVTGGWSPGDVAARDLDPGEHLPPLSSSFPPTPSATWAGRPAGQIGRNSAAHA